MDTNELAHRALLEQWQEKYVDAESQGHEFTWDGPANWEAWGEQKPRIAFLVKEARRGFHPSVKGQFISNKFGRNLFRWKSAITQLYTSINESVPFLLPEAITGTLDEVVLIEVKKLNEENVTSSGTEIMRYASEDHFFLREQIRLIDPQVVVCCGTIDSYDLIHDGTYETEGELNTIDRYKCWNLDGRLVIDFCHPATWPAHQPEGLHDEKLIQIIYSLLKHGGIFESFKRNTK